MIKYDEQGKCGIKIEQISLEALEKLDYIPEKQENLCTLFWAEDGNDIRLLFYSTSKSIQALEFMDYLAQDYVIVQGDEKIAQVVLAPVFLQAMMLDFEAKDIAGLLEKITEMYFVRCRSIYTQDFVKENHDMILGMPRYVKKKIAWAYVRTTDIMKAGDKFYLKSFENESMIILEASDDLYIMIGCRGEIYHINRDKFEQTYEPSEEQLDIYEQMLSYLPEVKSCEDGTFITLDEIAHLCYPKASGGIYAVSLESRTKVFNPYNNGEYFLGREGDYMAIRQDDLLDIYIIQKDIFHETYEEAGSTFS